MKSIVVIAPHPDDETLGCGGALLRFKSEGAQIHWILVTEAKGNIQYSKDFLENRATEIVSIEKAYGFNSVHRLGFSAAELSGEPEHQVIQKFSEVLRDLNPEVILAPAFCDSHSDHRVCFEATVAVTKWFRLPSIKQILLYETISETDSNPMSTFQPQLFINIENYLEEKLKIMSIYKSEIKDFPFPRSREAISSLAKYRGSMSGFKAAEAFQILREYR